VGSDQGTVVSEEKNKKSELERDEPSRLRVNGRGWDATLSDKVGIFDRGSVKTNTRNK